MFRNIHHPNKVYPQKWTGTDATSSTDTPHSGVIAPPYQKACLPNSQQSWPKSWSKCQTSRMCMEEGEITRSGGECVKKIVELIKL